VAEKYFVFIKNLKQPVLGKSATIINNIFAVYISRLPHAILKYQPSGKKARTPRKETFGLLY
jgi:hypothetical protein